MGKGAGLEIGEALGRQAGQIETRAAGGENHVLPAIGLEPDFGAVGELAHDFIKRMGRYRSGAGGRDHGRHALGDLDVEVRGAQLDMVFTGLEEDVGQDRIGVAALHHPMQMAQRLEQVIAFERDFHSGTFLAIGDSKTGEGPGQDVYSFIRNWQGQRGFAGPQSVDQLWKCTVTENRSIIPAPSSSSPVKGSQSATACRTLSASAWSLLAGLTLSAAIEGRPSSWPLPKNPTSRAICCPSAPGGTCQQAISW